MELISRQDALKKEYVFYYTGKPCINGHTAWRYVKSRQCVDCCKEWSSKYYSSAPGKKSAKLRAIKRNYGLTETELFELQAKYGLNCAICSRPKKLVIDHDHISGDVRGLLCSSCNIGIGFLEDNTEYLQSAISYLERK